jgi:hypothetical protein
MSSGYQNGASARQSDSIKVHPLGSVLDLPGTDSSEDGMKDGRGSMDHYEGERKAGSTRLVQAPVVC